MRINKSRLAGISLGALSVAALASPSFAQSLTWTTGNPVFSAEGVDRVVSGEYAELTLPGSVNTSTGVCLVTSDCFTYTSSDVSTPGNWQSGATAVVQFTLPTNETFDKCPTAAYGSGGFNVPTTLTCAVGGNTMTVQVTTNNSTTTGPGTITFPSFSVVGTGLQGLAQPIAAGGPNNCHISLSASCAITAFITASSNINFANQTVHLYETLAESNDTFAATTGVTTAAGPSCIDIDIWSYNSNGESFQQPCSNHPGGSGDVANKGSLTLTYVGGLTPVDGVSVFDFDNNKGTVKITGSADGNPQLGEPQGSDPVGSQNGGFGILPLTGENMVLVPIADGCPSTLAGALADNGIEGVITNNSATFSNVPFPPAPAAVGSTSTIAYEVCDYATGTAVIGAVAAWELQAAIDGPIACAWGTPNGCAAATDTNPELLGYNYNGAITWFNFTNGAYGDVAFLRVVNRNPSEPLSLGANGEEVVCLVTADDGTNGYASLYTNGFNYSGYNLNNSGSNNAGLPAGQNAYYPVPAIFAEAGIIPSASNPSDSGFARVLPRHEALHQAGLARRRRHRQHRVIFDNFATRGPSGPLFFCAAIAPCGR